MPTLRGSPWIAEAIESILAQTYRHSRPVMSENSGGSPQLAAALAPYRDETGNELEVSPAPLGAFPADTTDARGPRVSSHSSVDA